MYYMAVLLSQIANSVAFLPMIYYLNDSGYTANVPYTTLVLLLIGSFLQLVLAINRGYWFYVILFGILFGSVATMLLMKFNNEDNFGII